MPKHACTIPILVTVTFAIVSYRHFGTVPAFHQLPVAESIPHNRSFSSSATCFSQGKWVEGENFHNRPYVPIDPWQKACETAGREYRNWTWQPAETELCPLLLRRMNNANLCEIISNIPPEGEREQHPHIFRLLLVGDSLSFQMFASMVYAYGIDHGDAAEANQVNRHRRTQADICDGLATLTFIRNDFLIEGACEYCLDFWSEASSADVLLFNRGAHVLSNEQTVTQVQNFSRLLRTLVLDATQSSDQFSSRPKIFWRNTVPGHEMCDDVIQPFSPKTSKPLPHGWDSIPEQNALMLEILDQESIPFIFLDVFSLTRDRADRHIGGGDCLHYCLPGPPDTWVQMFIVALEDSNSLSAIRSWRYKRQQQVLPSTSIRKQQRSQPFVFVHWHVPKTYGMSLVRYFYESRCIVHTIISSTHYVRTLDSLFANISSSDSFEPDFCAILHIHAGSSPPFMRTRSLTSLLRQELVRRGGALHELVVLREPNEYVLSYFNYVCLIQNNCGEGHSHSLQEFNSYAIPNLQAKYLTWGHVGGWRTAGKCPSLQFDDQFKNCTVTEETCKELNTALLDVNVVPASVLELFVTEVLSDLIYRRHGVKLSHENSFEESSLLRGKKLSHNSSLVYPRSSCDRDLYLTSIKKSRADLD